MLTHNAVLSTVFSTNAFLQKTCSFGESDVFLSYLPLAHIFDRYSHVGQTIKFWCTDEKCHHKLSCSLLFVCHDLSVSCVCMISLLG